MRPRPANNRRRRPSGGWGAVLYLALWCLAAVIAGGCDPGTRYRALSFFFDGVPLPADQQAPEGAAGKAARTGREKARYVQHGPYAAKLCDSCHAQGTNKLLVRVEELCFTCHTFDLTGKKVHGPLASGGCTACHDPHGSPNRLFLVSDSQGFCLTCHDRDAVLKRDVHSGDGECTACHDAHTSSNAYLLK
jgi:predicted CXXCH cytochrome family protein